MALFKGKAKSFEREEKASGEPRSLAISYKMKRKASMPKPMEDCEHGGPEMCAHGCYADGGEVQDESEMPPTPITGSGVNKDQAKALQASYRRAHDAGTFNDADDIQATYRRAHDAGNFARGGMVDRVMARKMSKGGMVANTDLPEADFEPNEFDDLHLRDDLESHYTGANSGDELSSNGEDERRRDMVRRIMASRGKRAGHNPKPA